MAKYKKRSDGRYATTVTIGHDQTGKVIKVFLSAKSEAELKKKVIPAMGHIPLNKIKKSDAQRMINDRWDHPRTCQIIRMTLIQILDTAVEDKLINENVCRKLNMPKNEPAEKRQLTEEEKEAIKKADFTDRERMFVLILFYFGLRRGEALALTRSDVDLKNNSLSVNKAVTFDVNSPVIKSTKTSSGTRSIPIPSSVKPVLSDYLKKCNYFTYSLIKAEIYISQI